MGYCYFRNSQLKKIVERNREKYFGLIKPTLCEPTLVINNKDNNIFVKAFNGAPKDLLIFCSVFNDYDLFTRSNYEKTLPNLWNTIKTKAYAVFCYDNITGYANTIDGFAERNFEFVNIPLFDCKFEKDFFNNQIFDKENLGKVGDSYIIKDTRKKPRKDLDEIAALQKYEIAEVKDVRPVKFDGDFEF